MGVCLQCVCVGQLIAKLTKVAIKGALIALD